MSIVRVDNLKKSYNKGKVQALKGLSFEVEEGIIYGLIGPDGAGKTTLFRLLTTLLLADSGEALVDSLDVKKDYREIRRRIGYMPGKFSLYQDLTVKENLDFFASVFNTTVEENYHLIKDIYQQIEKFQDRKAGKLSGGMKQKLALSCALIHAPRVLFLDEPTTGVDPVSRKEFWEMLKKLKTDYKITILVSTPYMDEAVLCDRIALIDKGRFLQEDTPQAIINAYQEVLYEVQGENMHQLLAVLRDCQGVRSAFAFGETHHVTVEPGISPTQLRHELQQKDFQSVDIQPAKATIEDCFMNLMLHNHD